MAILLQIGLIGTLRQASGFGHELNKHLTMNAIPTFANYLCLSATISLITINLIANTSHSQSIDGVVSPAFPRSPQTAQRTMSLVLLNDIERLSNPPALFGGRQLATKKPIALLGIREIDKEISLDENQQTEIASIELKVQKDIEAFLFSAAPESEQTDLGLEILDKIKQLREMRDEALEQVLRENQKHRLKQIFLQMQIRSLGEVDGLANDHFASHLELGPEERKKLREFGKRVEAEMQKQIEAIQETAKQRIREQLNQEQQTRLFELLGEQFDFRRLNQEDTDKQ